jgi:protein O-GlcNAc transferase
VVGDVEGLFRGALASLQAGRTTEAEHSFRALLDLQPNHIAGLNIFSLLLTRLERFEEAEQYVRRVLNAGPPSDVTLYNYGVILKALKRPGEALERFSQALAINDSVAETWNNRGTVYNDLGRHQEAVADFAKAISINPTSADAFHNKGRSLARLQQHALSLDAFQRAIALKPGLVEAWYGAAAALIELKRYDEAIRAYGGTLELKPDLVQAWVSRGNILAALKRYDEALSDYDRALAINPHFSDAWRGRGDVFAARQQLAQAQFAHEQSRAVQTADAERVLAKLTACDWADLDQEVSQLLSKIGTQRAACGPFTTLCLPTSPADQLQYARRYVELQPPVAPTCRGDVYSHDRIRIAYVSADFHDHATAYLMAGLFEQHDKARFEITAISFGPDQKSDARDRIEGAFEHFLDVREKSAQEIVEIVRSIETDIAVDLKGFTKNAKPYVFACRMAPIQVNFLGYPGTIGANYMDYILADQTVIPECDFAHYSEKVAWLPDSYQVNDDRRRISERTPTRRECGLPESGFVFCCFNNSFKITPSVFDVWMRLLKEIDRSVLWLFEANITATHNLRREAQCRGVSPDRLVFAKRIPVADHLARLRQADLFLDNLPYNAHTTASDALWAGVPIVTCLGSTFAGRVAGSLLKAIGLRELITTSLEDYEALALKIARDPSRLAALKAKLAHNRGTYPLFDTKRFARHIEAAYVTMWERLQRGEAPKAFAVDPID